MSVRFLEVAQRELDEAVIYYNSQTPGLGERMRRCLLRRFPYGLIYHEELGDILNVAMAHLHRQPEYWRDRLKRS